MKLTIATLLVSLAVIQAQEGSGSGGEVFDDPYVSTERPPSKMIHFVGDGCVDYDPADPDWKVATRGDDFGFARDTGIVFDWYGNTFFPLDIDGTILRNKTQIYINSNGLLTLNGASTDYVPDAFNTSVSSTRDMIAPFWSDVNTDNTQKHGHIMWKNHGPDKFVVVWHEVTEYHNPDTTRTESYQDFLDTPENYDTDTVKKTNTFQAVLTEPNHICFCYCKMEWAHADILKDEKSLSLPLYPATIGIKPHDHTNKPSFLLGRFDHDFDAPDPADRDRWEGFGSENNGVQHLDGRSYCFTTDIIYEDDPADVMTEQSGVCGDPHFKTWKGEHFEYHGQCDLVIAKDPNFADGLGLDIHIRTKLVRFWSYIKNAVIRIGDDILEIQGSAMEGVDKEVHYWINYEYQGELTEFAGFPVTISSEGTKSNKNKILIDLSSKYPGQRIILSTFKEFVKVDFGAASVEAFGNTVGMLGNFHTGKTVARDGATVLDNYAELGHEWQVLPSDGKFFREASEPQFPKKCIDPEDPQGDRRRRLSESTISVEQAEAACAGLKSALDRKDCVYDILATQDMDMVGAF